MAFREPPLVKRTKAVLEACDQFRDIDQLRTGVRIEDKPTGPVWVLLDPAAVEAEMRTKAEAKEKSRPRSTGGSQAEECHGVSGEMFRGDKYSAWDERGLPTHDAAG